ncbi:MAG: LPS-assembly protein LptD [Gammaproteobacteria bacterium CG_4_10_14_0_8_um_filter_38_16]|nr:MAG: LPS-assembly protein LptD [Gammaproteobacteria bacterium CG_4_10_14_0_8_um_filter_38_16]PJA03162.1 MAG: LPS-assembly protein LptD [Gammaproteobacteria bacterium CG_4_10_14_0_2_um_filter_38_22]PJB09954.1 MAG: LPS-assembly protein LptD [Gammaproteobacteria bacterium CG_4_9_14_3_um_filter_38_9]
MKSIHLLSAIITITGTLFCNTIFAASSKWDDQKTIADALGWHASKNPSRQCQLCGGYYIEPRSIAAVPNPPNPKSVPATITAKGPVVFRANGVSVLRDDVVITQPGRIVHADRALIYHNQKTGKISHIHLMGHVKVEEDGKLLVGHDAEYNISKNTFTINHVAYHLVGEHLQISNAAKFNAWGTAKKIHRTNNGVIDLTNATYSTCPPIDPSWIISAKTMRLDHASGEGYAKNAVVRFKGVPILYTPYYSFPLNDDRKSGILPPSGGYATGHGFYFSVPYYWNIAPNYDAIITPQWYSDRGVQLNTFFRYLTSVSDGFFYTSILPDDNEFLSFKRNTLNNYRNNTSTDAAPYISQLNSDHRYRGFFDFENHVEFNQFWSGKFYARYVTDPYFAEDFQSEYLGQNTNQVPSLMELDYQGTHWDDTFLVQSYQTLHPIDQILSPAQNQYTRLPEINFNAAYPDALPHVNFNLSGQAVNFDYNSAFTPLTYQMPIGGRLHIQPSISRPFTTPSLFLTPKITTDITSYFARLPANNAVTPRPSFDKTRTLPIFDIDSGLYFDRIAHFGGKNYIQTLEPRLFYLYTPYLNQNSYPNFDTQLLPFSIVNLYSLNQFTGFDRVQNANQLSIGLTSNMLRASDASDVLNAQLGFIDYFTDPRVCLAQGCNPKTGSISPITGSLTWSPNALWAINSQAAWDTTSHQINNAQLNTEYRMDERHIIVLGYQFAHSNSDTPFDAFGFSTNSSLITAGLVWPVTLHWHFFGYTYYDLTHHRPQNQYVGLSYGTCCWAVRAIIADNFIGATSENSGTTYQNQYSSAYYVEFLLKGLGSAGNRRAEDMLTSTLPGFSDLFSNRGHYGYS